MTSSGARPSVRRLDARFYPDFARGWDNQRFREYVLARLTGVEAVLDFGAGRGACPQMDFRGEAGRIVGTDPSRAVLGNPFLDEAIVMETDSGRIPCPAESFDMVVSNNVLEHIERPQVVFDEVFRVLRPRGLFIAKTPNERHYVPMIARLTPHRFHEHVNARRGRASHDTFQTRYRCNRPRRVTAYAREAGFVVEDLRLWEGRPEYLRFGVATYLVGLAYERFVNASEALAGLRAVMVFALRKPGPSPAHAPSGES